MRVSIKKNRELCLAIFIICTTLIGIVAFLVFKKVAKSNLYYFNRIYRTEAMDALLFNPARQTSTLSPKTKSADIIDTIQLDSKRILSLETMTADDKSLFAFYISTTDGYKKNRKCVYKIPFSDKYGNKYERSMAYYGTFLKSNESITFTFSHLPYIVVFTKKGYPITAIKTKDEVPNPVIIQYKDYYLYKRAETFSSNISAYTKNGNVYVFSYRVPIKSKQFVIDVYDLSTKNYKYSVVAYNKQLENNIDINRVYADSLSIYLETRKGYYQLTD